MTSSQRHSPPAPLSVLLEVKLSPAARRARRIASLQDAVLELRSSETAAPSHRYSVIDASITPTPARRGIVLQVRECVMHPASKIRLFLFTQKKYAVWVQALQDASSWKLTSFYRLPPEPVLLGKGLFASVFQATDADTAEVVAVKTIPKIAAASPSEPMHPKLDTFIQRESRISRLVHHDCIVNFLDVFETPTSVSIVMAAYPHTLPDLINAAGGILDELTAAHVASSLLRALNYLHERDIVHRDIKPENVLCSRLEYPMKIVLCDFGLSNFVDRRAAHIAATNAKIASNENSLPDGPAANGHRGNSDALLKAALDGFTFSSAVGTPAFCAPEIIERERYGAPVDVWGVGILLYYMLCGSIPFTAEDPSAVLERIREVELNFSDGWADVSVESVSLIRSMLNRDQRKRISVEAALIHPWILKPPTKQRLRPRRSSSVVPEFSVDFDATSAN